MPVPQRQGFPCRPGSLQPLVQAHQKLRHRLTVAARPVMAEIVGPGLQFGSRQIGPQAPFPGSEIHLGQPVFRWPKLHVGAQDVQGLQQGLAALQR